jgi:hypothetical protein
MSFDLLRPSAIVKERCTTVSGANSNKTGSGYKFLLPALVMCVTWFRNIAK